MTPLFALLLMVNGIVTNQSTGKPQQNVTVTLYKVGQDGPEALESVKSAADGKFAIDKTVTGPHLVQAAFDGVTYNHMLFPGRPSEGIQLDVYNATTKQGAAKVNTHMILLESDGANLAVSESVVWENNGKASFYDPKSGAAKFYVPAGAGKVRVMCTHPAQTGIPIERAADKTGAANVYTVDFPIKPGETRFDLTYSLPGTEFDSRIVHGGGPVRIVVPNGITVEGKGVTFVDKHPETQASIYDVAGPTLSAKVIGTGSLRPPEPEEEADEGAGLQQIRPRLYERFYPVLALSFIILALGFLLLYRKPHGDPPPSA
ncbi:MAG: hypothetical protein R2762_26020 [Bryobacteraceae bacterium]